MQAKEDYAGRKTRCPECDRELTIPGPSENIEPAPRGRSEPPPEPRRPKKKILEPWEDEDDFDADERPRRGRRSAEISGKAITTLVCGLLGILCLPAALVAWIVGFLALRDISQSRGRLSGTGMAITGMIVPLVGVVASLLLLFPAVQKVRQAATRTKCQLNMKQIGIALHNYHDTNGSFPPAIVRAGRDGSGKPLYSWRVLILPYLEQDGLYKSFKLDEPWDGPNNIQLLSRMPNVYKDPGDTSSDATLTHYQVLVGEQAGFGPQNGPNRFGANRGPRVSAITDGTANTIMVVEAETAVPWSSPADLVYQPNQPLPRFASLHGDGFNVLFFDGSSRFLKNSIREQTLRAMITPNGGEAFDPMELDQ
jgi:prepilin-type processing-associated H-X9-DG protein